MDVVRILDQLPSMHRPVLLAAFRGWNDAGEAASGSIELLAEELDAEPFADIDPEEFFDFQATRPMVRMVDDIRRIEWPTNRFLVTKLPGSGAADANGGGRDRSLVLLDGTEPSLRWRTFSEAVADLALTLDVDLVITLGALQVDVPHTRPVAVTGNASDPELAARLGLAPSSYEGPTGITGVLHHACLAAGLDAASLWAGVPHYLAGAPYLTATLSLTERVLEMLGGDMQLEELAKDAAEQADDIRQLLDEDEDLAEYVSELEVRFAARQRDDDTATLLRASGEELAAEFERYLRDRGTG